MTTEFALDLRLARRKAGYTQGDMAHLLASHQSAVSDLELGKIRPSLEQIIELSLIYGRSFESLFGELMAERRKLLKKRLSCLPDLGKQTAHTFNRPASLERLKRRLAKPSKNGGA
ncbi:helix-turn-helix transcriptional regulator [Boseongicola sp. H5]|uniref:helix-turn-helix transcriptional regulator n=1 Tax=Boseongicola sp. H5 TaxID=2763261 RepID=UPI001D0A0F88|nr:helix-turn-helix transcriptional regulator [Boseongicola sp. H5]